MGRLNKLTEEDILRIWENGKFELYPDKMDYNCGANVAVQGINEHCYISVSKRQVFLYADGATSEEIAELINASREAAPQIARVLEVENLRWNVTAEVLRFMKNNAICKLIGTEAYYKFEGTCGSMKNIYRPLIQNYCDLMNNIRSTMVAEGCYTETMEKELSNKIYNGIVDDIYFGLADGCVIPIHGELRAVGDRCIELHSVMVCKPYDTLEYNSKFIRSIADFAGKSGYELRILDAKMNGLTPKQYKEINCRLIGRWWVVIQNL